MKQKQKHWKVSVFDQTIETIRDDTFYTTDTEVYLVFELMDDSFKPDTATVTVYNVYGKAIIHASAEIVDGVGDGIVRYKMPVEAIRQLGGWRTQVIFTKDKEDYTTKIIEFDVGGHLLDNKKPPIVQIENWNHFMKHAEGVVDDWEQIEKIRQANEQQRELAETERQNVFETNEAERENMFEERYEQVEEEYAPKLTEVTAQLAQTDDQLRIIKRNEVNIFDFEHYVTEKPDENDPNTWDWTVAIQEAIDFVTGSYEYNKLKFPPGKFKISDVVGISADGDVDIGLHIEGSGRSASTGRATTIEQTNSELDALVFINERSNLRGLVIEDMQVFGGKSGLVLKNSVYNRFENITFSRQSEYCLELIRSSLTYFNNTWFVHAHGNAIYSGGGGGTVFFSDCTIGEDIGGVHVNDNKLKFSNSTFHNVKNKVDETGMYELGNNIFGIDRGGNIELDSCLIVPQTDVENVFTINNQRDFVVRGCKITVQEGQALLSSRYQSGTYSGSPFIFEGNIITFNGNGTLFNNGVGVSSSPIKNAIMSNNMFIKEQLASVQTENWFLNPSYSNRMNNNILIER